MRSKEISRPSARGIAAPDRPVPDPRAVTGTLSFEAAFSSSDDLLSGGRFGDVRRPLWRLGQHLVVPVVLGYRVTGQQVVLADDLGEPRRHVAHEGLIFLS